ncbi:WASH complex subunit 3 [Copidosoma floridanum]|uniref:WASH complex subunit 3 n=1 Tax=Copidosoma floridanum TaxID=29053 RepID=UPI0006C9B8D3|nr:WASH complex subunit 3 [Copidosoma floridanum]
MSDFNIPIIEPTVDYTKIPPINQKRTIAFMNHFIAHTVTYLNKFALSCEEKLFEFENKIQKVEATLAILEAKLSTIPDAEGEQTTDGNVNETTTNGEEVKTVETKGETDEPDNQVPDKPPVEETDTQPVSADPQYAKYFKMIHFGVPKQAIKLKMEQEGLDSSVLE